MIRSNASLNCSCIDGIGCANGIGYCNETTNGKLRCREVRNVEPIDMHSLEIYIKETNILYTIGKPDNPELIRGTTRTQRTLDLFNEDEKGPENRSGCRWGETKNNQDRIEFLVHASDCQRIVNRGHSIHPVEKPLPKRMTLDETSRFLRALDRLEIIVEGTQFDIPNFFDETTPTDSNREYQKPVWSK